MAETVTIKWTTGDMELALQYFILNNKQETTAWKGKIVKFMVYLTEPIPKAPAVMPKSKQLF